MEAAQTEWSNIKTEVKRKAIRAATKIKRTSTYQFLSKSPRSELPFDNILSINYQKEYAIIHS
jgi:hypothetical protein